MQLHVAKERPQLQVEFRWEYVAKIRHVNRHALSDAFPFLAKRTVACWDFRTSHHVQLEAGMRAKADICNRPEFMDSRRRLKTRHPFSREIAEQQSPQGGIAMANSADSIGFRRNTLTLLRPPCCERTTTSPKFQRRSRRSSAASSDRQALSNVGKSACTSFHRTGAAMSS
jgi:hypothetical protein